MISLGRNGTARINLNFSEFLQDHFHDSDLPTPHAAAAKGYWPYDSLKSDPYLSTIYPYSLEMNDEGCTEGLQLSEVTGPNTVSHLNLFELVKKSLILALNELGVDKLPEIELGLNYFAEIYERS